MALKWKIFIGLGATFSVFLAGFLVWDIIFQLPDFTKLKESVPVPIRLANGDKSVRNMGPKTPGWTPLSGIAEWLPRAVVASEDASFYSHNGIDVFEMQEAFKKDLKEGRLARGASTITQQVLKNVYLSGHWRVYRKIKEVLWASKIEEALSKPQILAFYLNMAEWGPGLYGIGEASRHYFSVSPAGLTAKQSAFLAMLLPSPRRYHSFFREKRLTAWADKRVNRILTVMNKMGQMADDTFQIATTELLWGTAALPEGAPGVPADPGWDVSEYEGEVFEPVVEGQLPLKAATPAKPGETSIDPKAAPIAAPVVPSDIPDTAEGTGHMPSADGSTEVPTTPPLSAPETATTAEPREPSVSAEADPVAGESSEDRGEASAAESPITQD